MDPQLSEVTISQAIENMSMIAPLISGMWAVLTVIVVAVVAGAVWVTKISIAVKNNTALIHEKDNTVSSDMCMTHRRSCDKTRSLEFTTVAATLLKIEESINRINERHERYQEAMLNRSAAYNRRKDDVDYSPVS